MITVPPAPVRTPPFHNLPEIWKRFFLSLQSQVNLITEVITEAGAGPGESPAGASLMMFGLDSAEDIWPLPPGPQGLIGPQGMTGLPGVDGEDGEDAWPPAGLQLFINDLVVGGTARIGTGGSIFFSKAALANVWAVNLVSSADLNFTEVGVADNRLYLKAGGNIGVNTPAPNATLVIDDDITNQRGFELLAGSVPLLYGFSRSGGVELPLQIGLTKPLYRAISGNVGIATTSPSNSFVINDDDTNRRGFEFAPGSDPILFGYNRSGAVELPLRIGLASPLYHGIDGKVGIATISPGAFLDIGLAGTTLGTFRLEGNTSGYIQLQSAAAAGSWTMTLPNGTGTAKQILQTDGTGVTSWVNSNSNAAIDTTGLTADVAAATLFAVGASAAGMYRVSAFVVETTAASISSTLPNVQIVYTDNDTGGSVTIDATPILGIAGIGQTGALTANTVGTTATGVIVINATASTNIQYQTVNYASNLAGMAYALHIKLEAL